MVGMTTAVVVEVEVEELGVVVGGGDGGWAWGAQSRGTYPTRAPLVPYVALCRLGQALFDEEKTMPLLTEAEDWLFSEEGGDAITAPGNYPPASHCIAPALPSRRVPCLAWPWLNPRVGLARLWCWARAWSEDRHAQR